MFTRVRYPIKFTLKSKGKPQYFVWLFNPETNKWDCWGEINSPDDYPNIVERINAGEFRHNRYQCYTNYTKVYYQKIEDVGATPNKLGIL